MCSRMLQLQYFLSVLNNLDFTRHITSTIKEGKRYWKRILIVNDDTDVTVTFKVGVEDTNTRYKGEKKVFDGLDSLSLLA